MTARADQPGAGKATRRVFFALWPEEEQRAALAHATARAVRGCGGRPVPETSLHVTLCFLGSVAAVRMAELDALARRVAASRAAATVRLDFERLEHWVRQQVLCAIAAGATPSAAPPAAEDLGCALGDAAAAAGFSPDLRPFRAHVTLARKVVKARFDPRIRPVRWEFAAFALLESRTLATGPVYSVVDSYALVEAQKVHA